MADTLASISGMQRLVRDLFDPTISFRPDERQLAVFVYQLRGHAWTLIESHGHYVYHDTAGQLSKKLACRAMDLGFQDTIDAGGYSVFENGSLIEQYGFGFTPSFEDSNREENLAAGWAISDDNGRYLKSSRLANVDLNSPEAADLPSRTAVDFDLYVPYGVWRLDREGKPQLASGCSAADIQAGLCLAGKRLSCLSCTSESLAVYSCAAGARFRHDCSGRLPQTNQSVDCCLRLQTQPRSI